MNNVLIVCLRQPILQAVGIEAQSHDVASSMWAIGIGVRRSVAELLALARRIDFAGSHSPRSDHPACLPCHVSFVQKCRSQRAPKLAVLG